MIQQKLFSSLFFNACFDKNQLKNLIAWILDSYGEKRTIDFLEKLKKVGFHEATQAGVSLGLEDLQIPAQKPGLIANSLIETNYISTKSFAGNMTAVEKSQQMIDVWNQMSENLRQSAVQNFRNTNPTNPVFMMAFSGARGNISQVRQLVAMRGLMADPQGAILEFPIQSNFREGLTITEYLISCYGARKGLVDTALRTATSGYLTRRLVDAVQHIVVSMADCKTSKGIFIKKNLESRLIGRILAEDILLEKSKLIEKNQIISAKFAKIIASQYKKILVRSPLTCQAQKSICQLCYGGDLAHGILVNIGEAVGVIAAQSIGEPGTQLTMRTFHTGGVGVFSDQATKPLFTPFDGQVEFPEELIGHFVRTPHGQILYMVKYLSLNPNRVVLKVKPLDSSQNVYVIPEQELPAGSLLLVRQNEYVKAGQLLAQSSRIKNSKQEMPESRHPIHSPIDGEVFFESMLIWTHKNLPLKTKKQKIKENSNLPDIRTLGQLGSFWVFSSWNQRESSFLNTFLKSGDLVSSESFLFNYHFKISEKTQLKIINSKFVLGQHWNQTSFQTVRFHKFGYSLTLSTVALLKKSFSSFSQTESKNLLSYQAIQNIQNLDSQTIFYIKNSPFYAKKHFLIWFPISNDRVASRSFSSKNTGKVCPLDRSKNLENLTKPCKYYNNQSSKRDKRSLASNLDLRKLSYLSNLKNYSLKQYFSFPEFSKTDYFENFSKFLRTKNFLHQYSFINLRRNKSFFSNNQTSLLEMSLAKLSKNNVLFEKHTPLYTDRVASRPCYFFYNQLLFRMTWHVFLSKKYYIFRKINLKIKNFKQEDFVLKKNKDYFLVKTLTKNKFRFFEKFNTKSQILLNPKETWIYIPSIRKKSEGINTSKFIFLEQGKKFDNFLFSNSHVSFQNVQGKIVNIFSSQTKQTHFEQNFDYSKYELGNSNSIKLSKNLIHKIVIFYKNSLVQEVNSKYKLFSATSTNFRNCTSSRMKKRQPLFNEKVASRPQVTFFQKQETFLARKGSKTSTITKSFPFYPRKTSKVWPSIVFYTRNKNFIFSNKKNLNSRIISRIETSQKNLNHSSFLCICKSTQHSFFHFNELKNQWTSLQSQKHDFNFRSPLNSKQTLTLFSYKNQPQIKFQVLSPTSSGWIVGKQNFRVNLSFEINSNFNHTQPTLKFTNNQISCKPPLTFFSLFFYDFLSFETKKKFHFQTFSNGWVLPERTFTKGFLKLKTTGEFRRFEKIQNESFSSILKISDLITFKSIPLRETSGAWPLDKVISHPLLSRKTNEACPLSERQFTNLAIGQILRWGQEIFPEIASAYNGRIITLKRNILTIRLGVPFLASSRGILHINHKDLIQKNDLLVTLKSRRLQTEDIVQGIPKIEQLFEARETQGGEILSNNVHILLQNYFVVNLKVYPLQSAVSKSISKIQRFLIDNILDAYLNQGVKISEKHVEIVVKQMTTKVRILNGGYTGLVQGEIVPLTWIHELNKKLQDLGLEQATYEPIVLGISKSVLQSESFLLAASFQEVSRVLVRSALSRKTDFLRGLHENVILGQLIPAGTGLLVENHNQIDSRSSSPIPLKF